MRRACFSACLNATRLTRPPRSGGTAATARTVGAQGEAERLGRVTLVSCPGYLPRDPRTCTWAADPRGHGLAIGAD